MSVLDNDGFGHSFCAARQILLDSIEHKMNKSVYSIESPDRGYLHNFSLIFALSSTILVFSSIRSHPTILLSHYAQSTLLLGFLAINIMAHSFRLRQDQREMLERLESIISLHRKKTRSESVSLKALHTSISNYTVLLPSSCYTLCYRNDQWHRVPSNLLVCGDIIGLTNGDTAPGKIQIIVTDAESLESRVFERNEIILLNEIKQDTVRCNATFKTPLLLSLCGEMNIFQLLETPILHDIDNIICQSRPRTRIEKLQEKVEDCWIRLLIYYTLIVMITISARIFFESRNNSSAWDLLLSGPICIWLCLSSLNIPFVELLFESHAMAVLLAAMDDEILQKEPHFVSKKTNLHTDDAYDVEDRARLRQEIPLKSFGLSKYVQYLKRKIKFGFGIHTAIDSLDPIPTLSFRLIQRLGSTTMLCCFDDDILCQDLPSVEEIYLPSDHSSGSIVLDLHPDEDSSAGIRFENPRWKKHLPSLKPLGLAILLNDMDGPYRAHWERTMAYLEKKKNHSLDKIDQCCQQLSVHVRMLPYPKHLLRVSQEIGFVSSDTAHFQRQQVLHIISPRIAYHEHTIDHHDQGQEDTRYRGNIKSHLYSTVVLDKRCNRHQLLSRGHPAIAVNQCSEYWDGKSICPLTTEKRRAILDMYHQWRVEDLDCVVLSYVPISQKLNELFQTDQETHKKLEMLSPVYLVEDSLAGEDVTNVTRYPANAMHEEGSLDEVQMSSDVSVASVDAKLERDESQSKQARVSVSETTRRRLYASSETESAAYITSRAEEERDPWLWSMQQDQIFIGMIASGVQPKACIPDFVEDQTAAGVRFVYFSPRNMRRSKLLAEKMGIETDWNCAISLRSLESNMPDPHRMKSNYSDWDVKARLPHGVQAIRKHLQDVDNVPLLVSLYTDSTPEDIAEMISIFQGHQESILGVGSSLKQSNSMLYSRSDVAIAIQPPVKTLFDEPLSADSNKNCLSGNDMELSQALNTLSCCISITESKSESSLTLITELLRLGRWALNNSSQSKMFSFVSQLSLATQILVAHVLPFPFPPSLQLSSNLYLLWIYTPIICMTMLASPGDKDIMKRTPRKNDNLETKKDVRRIYVYFIFRQMPTIFMAISIHQCILGYSLAYSHEQLSSAHQGRHWMHYAMSRDLTTMELQPDCILAALKRAEGGMFCFAGISLLVSSIGYLYRCESIFIESPFRNLFYCVFFLILTGSHLVLAISKAGMRGLDGISLWEFITAALPWTFLATIFSWPVIIICVDELVKAHDRRHLTRYYKFLRMQFDTRLGMWSPK